MNALSRKRHPRSMLGVAGVLLAIHGLGCGSGDTDGAGGVGSSGGPEGPPAGGPPGPPGPPGLPGPTEAGKPAGVTSTSYYVYDLQGRLLGEYDANGKAVEELVYAEDRLVASARGNDLHPVFTDQVGAPRMVANASGKPLWRWGGEPFGASAPEPDADGDGTPFTFSSRFPGQVADPETGLSYNYFRDYAPALGRYIEPDPIGLAGGPNLYLYVGGSPLGNSDPLGLAPDIDLMPRSGDPAAIYRDRVPNDPNVITVFAHGAPDRVVDQRRGGVVNVDDKALADMIRKTDKWKRGVRNVRFIACDTGKTVDGKPSIAQQVASLLRDGARVEAPDSYVRTDSTGRQIVGYGDYYNQVGGVFLPGTYRTFWKSF